MIPVDAGLLVGGFLTSAFVAVALVRRLASFLLGLVS